MTLRPGVESTGVASSVDPLRLQPPYDVEDGLTIGTQAGRVRIAGLEGPGRRAICLNSDEKLWACGLQARAALVNLIRGQTVTCQRTAPRTGNVPEAACSVAGRDIGQALVSEGFARPIGEGAALRPAMKLAQAGSRGLWNGGWSIRR